MIQPQVIVQNDYGYQIPFTLEDGNGNPVNLSGASLTLKAQSAQDPTDTNLTLSGSMAIDSASAGTCHYTVANGDFPNPGTLLTMVVATWSSSETLSWIGPQLIVKPSLPQSIN
jgi:hypothetical protein